MFKTQFIEFIYTKLIMSDMDIFRMLCLQNTFLAKILRICKKNSVLTSKKIYKIY